MAKESRSAADLDAELAALEAELAALEGRSKKAKKPAPKEAAAPAPAPDTQPPAEAPERPAKKSRFALPKLGKKEKPPAAAPQPAEAPATQRAPEPPAASQFGQYDASVWRHEGEAWVRVVPETPVPAVRRILDEEGNVVREEPADQRAVEEASGVKAERGLGRLLRRK